MQEPQQRVERVGQHALRDRALGVVLQAALDHLDVEAAKLVPGEIVKHPGGIGVTIFFKCLIDRLVDGRQAAQNPFVLDEKLVVGDRGRCKAFEVHHRESRGVPELIAEVPRELETIGNHRPAGQGFVLGLFGPLRRELLAAHPCI